MFGFALFSRGAKRCSAVPKIASNPPVAESSPVRPGEAAAFPGPASWCCSEERFSARALAVPVPGTGSVGTRVAPKRAGRGRPSHPSVSYWCLWTRGWKAVAPDVATPAACLAQQSSGVKTACAGPAGEACFYFLLEERKNHILLGGECNYWQLIC